MNIYYGKNQYENSKKDKLKNMEEVKKTPTNMGKTTQSTLDVPPYKSFVKG